MATHVIGHKPMLHAHAQPCCTAPRLHGYPAQRWIEGTATFSSLLWSVPGRNNKEEKGHFPLEPPHLAGVQMVGKQVKN